MSRWRPRCEPRCEPPCAAAAACYAAAAAAAATAAAAAAASSSSAAAAARGERRRGTGRPGRRLLAVLAAEEAAHGVDERAAPRLHPAEQPVRRGEVRVDLVLRAAHLPQLLALRVQLLERRRADLPRLRRLLQHPPLALLDPRRVAVDAALDLLHALVLRLRPQVGPRAEGIPAAAATRSAAAERVGAGARALGGAERVGVFCSMRSHCGVLPVFTGDGASFKQYCKARRAPEKRSEKLRNAGSARLLRARVLRGPNVHAWRVQMIS